MATSARLPAVDMTKSNLQITIWPPAQDYQQWIWPNQTFKSLYGHQRKTTSSEYDQIKPSNHYMATSARLPAVNMTKSNLQITIWPLAQDYQQWIWPNQTFKSLYGHQCKTTSSEYEQIFVKDHTKRLESVTFISRYLSSPLCASGST